MDLDLTCVESFVVVANERHFGRAAIRLNLTRSALWKRIDRLERSVGASLIERDNGGYVDLTKAGTRFLGHCEPLLRAAREARRDALRASEAPVVRVGIPGSPTDHFPAQTWQMVALGVRQLVPDCRLELRDVPYGRVAESLHLGWVDVLLTTSLFDHASLISRKVGLSGRVLHVPAGHIFYDASTTTLAEVADLPLIREPTASPNWMAPWLLGDLRGPADIRTVDVRARTIGDIQLAVRLGVGVGVFAAVTPIVHPGVAALPILDAPPVPIYAVRRCDDERDQVFALLQTVEVLSAALSVQHDVLSASQSTDGLGAWWVSWAATHANGRFATMLTGSSRSVSKEIRG